MAVVALGVCKGFKDTTEIHRQAMLNYMEKMARLGRKVFDWVTRGDFYEEHARQLVAFAIADTTTLAQLTMELDKVMAVETPDHLQTYVRSRLNNPQLIVPPKIHDMAETLLKLANQKGEYDRKSLGRPTRGTTASVGAQLNGGNGSRTSQPSQHRGLDGSVVRGMVQPR